MLQVSLALSIQLYIYIYAWFFHAKRLFHLHGIFYYHSCHPNVGEYADMTPTHTCRACVCVRVWLPKPQPVLQVQAPRCRLDTELVPGTTKPWKAGGATHLPKYASHRGEWFHFVGNWKGMMGLSLHPNLFAVSSYPCCQMPINFWWWPRHPAIVFQWFLKSRTHLDSASEGSSLNPPPAAASNWEPAVVIAIGTIYTYQGPVTQDEWGMVIYPTTDVNPCGSLMIRALINDRLSQIKIL